MANLKTRILEYDRHLNETYLRETVNSASPAELCTNLIELLREPREHVWKAALFVVDLSLGRAGMGETFRRSFDASGVVTAIEENLFRRDYHVRKTSIHALGKMGSLVSVPALMHAFDHYLNSDPLILGNVIGELGWLTSDEQFPLIKKMIDSSQYTIRWATLPLLENQCKPIRHADRFAQALIWLDRLREDPHPLVAAEARYDLELLRCYQDTKDVEKREKYRKRKVIRKAIPPITFTFQVELGFLNQMTGPDYTISELEHFIHHMA